MNQPIGIYLETQDGQVKTTNAELITLAHQAGRAAVGILLGGDPQPIAKDLAPYGLSKIIHVEGATVQSYHCETYAQQLAEMIGANQFSDFLGADTAQGKDLMPRVAAQLEAPLISDCIAVDLGAREAIKPMYSGKVNARVKLNGEPRLYSVRPNAVAAAKCNGQQAEITSVEARPHTTLAEIREIVQSVSKEVDLAEAPIIVSGGFGMGSAENFDVLRELSDVLGGAVGASRRAVDEGLAPYDMQVGQTGKVVNPQLYIACGISGAVQHFAGMKSSRVIVAVNRDPDAPIFKKAHYGIVGDLFEVVPQLTAQFRQHLGNGH